MLPPDSRSSSSLLSCSPALLSFISHSKPFSLSQQPTTEQDFVLSNLPHQQVVPPPEATCASLGGGGDSPETVQPQEELGEDSPETYLGASLHGNSLKTSYGMNHGDSSQPLPRASPNVDVQTENIHDLQGI
ncbi:hypothetical protein LguiB_005676 [Lonicera macranthoides]